MYPHTHTLILTSKHSPIIHLFTRSKHSISSLKVIWRKDQKLDQAIEKDKIFKQSLKVIKEVLNEPNQIIPLRYLEKRRKRLRLPVKAETFIRRNPTLFDVYYDRIRPKSDLVKFLRISDTLKRVLDRNERVYLKNEDLIVAKLCKLLMMSKNNVVSADKLVHVKREFGFPNDFIESLVPRYPQYFKVVGSGEGRTFLELVSWNEVFAKSVIEKRADEESEKTGIRVRPGFDWKLPSGFFIRKEMREWIRDWMERPYVSPYEDVSNLDQASLEMEKRTVGVFHELLSLSLYNKQVVMDSTTRTSASWCLLVALVAFVISVAKAQPLVPAIMTFGDSAVDVGNNDYIATIFKANYPPYGRDFPSHKPTGRFCNGKLATDITADTLGFTTYPPAYLSPEASGKNLLIGANFASAGSGLDEKTSAQSHAISLQQQL